MPTIIKLIPLILATGFNLLSLIGLAMAISSTPDGFVYVIPQAFIYATASLVLIWLSLFLKKNIWAYLFLIAIITSVFTDFDFVRSSFFFRIGSVHFDLLAISLLIAHFGLNSKEIIPQKSEKEVENDENEAINYFKKQFVGKTHVQLTEALKGDLVPEARKAIEELISERSNQ